MSDPIDNVYRLPYEFVSAAAMWCGAAAVLATPASFLLSPWQGLAAGCALLILACWRLMQGRRIARHRRVGREGRHLAREHRTQAAAPQSPDVRAPRVQLNGTLSASRVTMMIGVGATLEACRRELREVVEEWILVRVSRGLSIPKLGRASIRIKKAS